MYLTKGIVTAKQKKKGIDPAIHLWTDKPLWDAETKTWLPPQGEGDYDVILLPKGLITTQDLKSGECKEVVEICFTLKSIRTPEEKLFDMVDGWVEGGLSATNAATVKSEIASIVKEIRDAD